MQKSVVSVLDSRHDHIRRLAQSSTANRYTTLLVIGIYVIAAAQT
jgi:hypothetical protein